jgi:isopenicillin N synthase-like dioxygenase
MLSALSTALPLPLLHIHHQPTSPSDSSLKLISEPSLHNLADVVENKHTDRGTFTLLFHECWGLHIELPREGKWAFTAPPAQGCVLVNVADSLERLSGDRLRSPVHRVTQIGDGAEERHFISYFLRPENALKEAWAKG